MGPFAKLEEDARDPCDYLDGHRWILHYVGAEPLFLDLLPRRCMPLAEQLLGPCVQPTPGEEGEVRWRGFQTPTTRASP